MERRSFLKLIPGMIPLGEISVPAFSQNSFSSFAELEIGDFIFFSLNKEEKVLDYHMSGNLEKPVKLTQKSLITKMASLIFFFDRNLENFNDKIYIDDLGNIYFDKYKIQLKNNKRTYSNNEVIDCFKKMLGFHYIVREIKPKAKEIESTKIGQLVGINPIDPTSDPFRV